MLLVVNYGGIIDPKGGFFVQIFGKTDVGLVRETNQDTFMSGDLTPSVGFALVCDGMGGENGGNVASQLARDIISTQVMQNLREYLSLIHIYVYKRQVYYQSFHRKNGLCHRKSRLYAGGKCHFGFRPSESATASRRYSSSSGHRPGYVPRCHQYFQ